MIGTASENLAAETLQKSSRCCESLSVVLQILNNKGCLQVGKKNDQICGLRSNLRRLKVKFCIISLRRYCFIILTGAFPLFRSNESYSVDYSTLFWQNVKEDKRGIFYFADIFVPKCDCESEILSCPFLLLMPKLPTWTSVLLV